MLVRSRLQQERSPLLSVLSAQKCFKIMITIIRLPSAIWRVRVASVKVLVYLQRRIFCSGGAVNHIIVHKVM